MPDLATLRQQLNLRFDDAQLTDFCLDHFTAVYDRLGRGMLKDEKITLLLDYCRSRPAEMQRLETLLQDDPSSTGNQSTSTPSSRPLVGSTTTAATYNIHIQNAQGIAIGDGAQAHSGQNLPAPAQTAPPGISVRRMSDLFPTAYSRHLNAGQFPFITVLVDNTGAGCGTTRLCISAVIEDYSDTAVETLTLAQGQQIKVPLLPVLKQDAMERLNDIRPATLRVAVQQIEPAGRLLYDNTERIYLQARDIALLGQKAPDGSILDLSDYLAAWVTPRHPQLEILLNQAARRHPEGRLTGYQGVKSQQDADKVRQQALAIFSALRQDAGLVYVGSSLSLTFQNGQMIQRVRLPGETLASRGSANCADGSVLFASLLELAGIKPLLVIIPGHIFLAWRIIKNTEHYEYLETTMIGERPDAAPENVFRLAQTFAKTRVDLALQRGFFSRGLYDPGGFARLVDIAACRAKGIYPLE